MYSAELGDEYMHGSPVREMEENTGAMSGWGMGSRMRLCFGVGGRAGLFVGGHRSGWCSALVSCSDASFAPFVRFVRRSRLRGGWIAVYACVCD